MEQSENNQSQMKTELKNLYDFQIQNLMKVQAIQNSVKEDQITSESFNLEQPQLNQIFDQFRTISNRQHTELENL